MAASALLKSTEVQESVSNMLQESAWLAWQVCSESYSAEWGRTRDWSKRTGVGGRWERRELCSLVTSTLGDFKV